MRMSRRYWKSLLQCKGVDLFMVEGDIFDGYVALLLYPSYGTG